MMRHQARQLTDRLHQHEDQCAPSFYFFAIVLVTRHAIGSLDYDASSKFIAPIAEAEFWLVD
jgi:hypothetical protein